MSVQHFFFQYSTSSGFIFLRIFSIFGDWIPSESLSIRIATYCKRMTLDSQYDLKNLEFQLMLWRLCWMWHASRLFGATQILEITTEPLKVIEILILILNHSIESRQRRHRFPTLKREHFWMHNKPKHKWVDFIHHVILNELSWALSSAFCFNHVAYLTHMSNSFYNQSSNRNHLFHWNCDGHR